MQGHFLRHTPADPAALMDRVTVAEREFESVSARGDTQQLIDCAGNLVALLTAARREAEAVPLGCAYLSLARANTTMEESGWLLHNLATAAQYHGLRGEANHLFAEALELCRLRGWRRLEHFVLHHWGRSRVEEGELDLAERCFLESRAIRIELEDPLVASSERAIAALHNLRRADSADGSKHAPGSA